jgi:glycosyltransferase involved in cell wall biosynthesis
MKIAVYAISKNEAKFIRRCIESARDADAFVLLDTGSTDDTVALAKEAGAIVLEGTVNPWRFDSARNLSSHCIPDDADVCVCIDIDEVLEPGWRAEIERLWTPGTTRMRFLFDSGKHGTFIKDKIHNRFGYRWQGICHEYLVPLEPQDERFVDSEKLLMRHLPDDSKSRAQYLDLLRWGAEEEPGSARNAFYYARELVFYYRHLEAIRELERYLSLPSATWPAERALAMRLLGQMHDQVCQSGRALAWYRRGAAESPERREPWVALAEACYQRGLWPECYSAATTALAIKEFRTAWPMEPEAWGWKPHDLLAIACYHLGHFVLARQQGALALQLAPEDARLQANLRYYEMALQLKAHHEPPETGP